MLHPGQRHFGRLLLVIVLAGMPWNGVQAEGISWDVGAYRKFSAIMHGAEADRIVYTEDRSPSYVLTRFVIEGESADDWIEAFEVLDTLRRNAPKTVNGWYEQFRQKGEQHCPGSEWNVIAQDSDSLTFERRTSDCGPFAEQHALYRVIYGNDEVFTLIATRKGSMDDETRSSWLAVLASATI